MLEDIARDLAGEVVFPTCFDTALRLRKEMQNPDLPISRIVDIVSLEPLIAAKLMQMANSALYCLNGMPVRTLQGAISRLGINLVRTTALAIAIGQLMRPKEMVQFSGIAHSLWEHSIKTAVAARALAGAYTRINPDEALLAGLVHDLGAFYMLYRAVQYTELTARPETLKHLIVQWHESIGVSLLCALGLPEDIVNSSIDHDQPRGLPESVRSLSDIVYIANVLAGAHFEWLFQDFDPEEGEAGEIHRKFADLMPGIEADFLEMKAAFGQGEAGGRSGRKE